MDIERTMQFIVETLADVAVRQQKAELRADRADARIDKLERQIRGMQTLVKTGMRWLNKHDQHLKELDEKMKQLAGEQLVTQRMMQQWLAGRNGSNGHSKRPK